MKTPLISLLMLCASHAALAAGPAAHTHAPGHDVREILSLTPEERAIILEEMHLFLDAVQKMTGALGEQDMPAVARAARAVGQQLGHEVPASLRAKLPLEFRQLGHAAHGDFDQMALDAETLGDVSHSLGQLSSTLKKCVSCHAGYQIRTPAFDARH